jgi:hypothetical protein
MQKRAGRFRKNALDLELKCRSKVKDAAEMAPTIKIGTPDDDRRAFDEGMF